MNAPEVKEDLHARQDIKWELCNATIAKIYKRDPKGSFETYKNLLKA